MVNGGPFRESRPAERRVARSETQQAAPAEPTRQQSVAAAAHAPARVENPVASSKKPKWLVLVILIVVITVLGWTGYATWKNSQTGIDGSKYQAVFLSNGQVYFGKLQAFSGEYMKVTDVFYLQGQQTEDSSDSANPQANSNQADLQLIKLGSEIHGPEDQMVLAKEQILFYENLKDDGKVAQSIKQYKESN